MAIAWEAGWSLPWPDVLCAVRRQLRLDFDLDFNSALLNYYRDGDDSMGWHSDDLQTGADATALTGQLSFHDKGDNRWQPQVADSLCWPYGLQVCGDLAVVADSGNNRVLLWRLGSPKMCSEPV